MNINSASKTLITLLFCFIFSSAIVAQDKMTPELLWGLNQVNAIGITKDNKSVIYSVSTYKGNSNTKTKSYFQIPLTGSEAKEIKSYKGLVADKHISPDNKHIIKTHEVKIKPVFGTDTYPEMTESNVQIYDNLNYRHWDKWEDGKFSHVFIHSNTEGANDSIDIMATEPYDCPQQPFGGSEDYTWNPDGTKVLYVTKKKYGTAYAISTNSDIYEYDLATKKTVNLTEANDGYDTQPAYSSKGVLAYCQMKEDGNEANKNDIIIILNGVKINLTKDWDRTVKSFLWSTDGTKIYLNAATDGTVQLFEIVVPKKAETKVEVKQITNGQFDVKSLIGQVSNTLVVARTDMNHNTELYTVDLKTGKLTQLTHANDAIYAKIKLSEVKKRMVTTTDGKQMVTWVIYPPDFDPNKKYPTLLYCQGGPQSALSQFYSIRWNFQLMAAHGYIVVAPNRRGMPGHGVEWNAQISEDWGGQNIKDYLSAIDDVAKEPYVDKERLGCVGASYGGFSVFYLAGMHENRFKTFIAHDGVFNHRSMYGTTEEVFFTHHEMGGAYWDKGTEKSYNNHNPVNYVDKWNTPILIIQGGKDFRVPIGQGLEAFQAAQLRGIKSKLLYFPEENHWILTRQNGIIWHKEFYKWLAETLTPTDQ
ncbi:MAG: S9 family peptidase [Vicingus serpentipes]|nr:S9 family peptidase [Vicingus serpentipes]